MWLGARWRGYSCRRVRALPPRALRCSVQACCAAEQGRDPYSWASSAHEHEYLPLLALLALPPAPQHGFSRACSAGFSKLVHLQSGRSCRTGTLLPDFALCAALARPCFVQATSEDWAVSTEWGVSTGGWLAGRMTVVGCECFWYGADEFCMHGRWCDGRHYATIWLFNPPARISRASSARSAHSANSITSQWSAKGIACR